MVRPRVLDVDKAMETATAFFWRNGYERTSVADLTQAMGITPPSFYFAFGSKDGLFLKVLENYLTTRMGPVEAALQEPTARGVAEVMLRRMADLYGDDSHPPGCLAVNCALAGGGEDGRLREEMGKYRGARRARLRGRLQRAKDEGDLDAGADPDELAGFIMSVGWGMAIDAQGGAGREQLHRTVDRAMKAWPG
jgi:AcrR family transcriptional regulator